MGKLAASELSENEPGTTKSSSQRAEKSTITKKIRSKIPRKVRIQVNGVEDELRKNVLAHISRSGTIDRSEALNPSDFKKLRKNLDEEAREALQAYGYYDPHIEIKLDSDEHWDLAIDVQPGERVLLREVQLGLAGEGASAEELIKLRDESALRTGNVLSHQTYKSYKSALAHSAYSLGYLDAQFLKHELRIYPEQHVADVFLEFDTGRRYFFGPITVEQDILNEDFVEKFIKPKAGDPFESDQLTKLQLTLSETNYFSHVDVDVKREETENYHIPVTVQVSPTKAAKYDFSGGYGTDTGPRIGLNNIARRVNRKGHHSKSLLEYSRVKSSLVTKYLVPIGDVSSEYLGYNAEVKRERVNEVDVVEYSVSTSLNQNRWRGRRRLGLELSHENWAIGELPRQKSTLLIPSLDFTTKHSDDPFFIRRGYSAALRLQGGVEDVLSDVSFGQAQLYIKAVHSLSEKTRVLLRAELGATVVDEFDQLPPSLRFFAGGSQSVRGYGYKDLSPVNEEGDRIGGKYLAVFSTELDYLITDTIGVAAFVDAGDATREPLSSLKLGAGLGIRFKSPVGLLRVDVAHPFDNPNEKVRLHLSFGIDL